MVVVVVAARGGEVDTVSAAVTDDENETRQDVSIFVKKGGGGGGSKARCCKQPPPTVFDFRRVGVSDDDDGDGGDDVGGGWFSRAASNSIIHAVVETRLNLTRRRACACSRAGRSIVACIATCFFDVTSLRTYAVANDSALNLQREIVDRGPVLFALDVCDGAARVPACLLGWHASAWIVGLPIGATTRDLDAWWRNGCVLIPFSQLPVAALDFIACARASSLQTTHSEDTGTTRVQLFEYTIAGSTRRQPQQRQHRLAKRREDKRDLGWTYYTDAAFLVVLGAVTLALVVLITYELVALIFLHRKKSSA